MVKFKSKLMKELITLITTSQFHAIFLTEAISVYSKEVLNNKEQLKKDMKQHIIAPELWIDLAEDYNKIVNKPK